MKYLLLIVGLVLALLGFSFFMKYLKVRRESVKVIGRVVDNRKVEGNSKMPSGWAAVAEYEANGKIVRGVSSYPMAQKYATGYKLELYRSKKTPSSFVPGAFTQAMVLYSLLLPVGMALAIWGVTLFF